MYDRNKKAYGVICPVCNRESFYQEEGVMNGITIPLCDNIREDYINGIEDIDIVVEDDFTMLPYYWKCAHCDHKYKVNFFLSDTVPENYVDEDSKTITREDLDNMKLSQEISKEKIKIIFNRLAYLKLYDEHGKIDNSKFTTIIKGDDVYSATKLWGRIYVVHKFSDEEIDNIINN